MNVLFLHQLISKENSLQFFHAKRELSSFVRTNSHPPSINFFYIFFYSYYDFQPSMISYTHGLQSTSPLTLWNLLMGDHQGRSGAPPQRPEQQRTTELHPNVQMQVRAQVNLKPMIAVINTWISGIDSN